ncbi:MAG: DUF2225 domain-containing protein [Clostridiaceae bacterium]|jgi:uncharacterized protein (DUF2225 family)|nr:DUF2225 domain-containing protein [Clostridiaceae bacterium]
MPEIKPYYNSTIICPVCNKQIQVTKVRSKFVKLIKQDEDFCPYYESINPIFYEAWICGNCGYAAHSTVFNNATTNDQRVILNKLKGKWTKREFSGERDVEKALEAFKIVLYNLQLRSGSFSEFAKICLRLAWLYRYKGEWVNEHKFLKFSYDYYKKSYTGEYLKDGKLDEYTCMYIIGELARRLGNNEEALQWLGRLITASARADEKGRIPPVILENTQNLIYDIREAQKKKKMSGTEYDNKKTS